MKKKKYLVAGQIVKTLKGVKTGSMFRQIVKTGVKSFIIAIVAVIMTAGNVSADTEQVSLRAPRIRSLSDRGEYELIKWKSRSAEADGYEIECSTHKHFDDVDLTINIVDPMKKSANIENLKKNTVYFVRLRSYRQSGEGIQYSEWSRVRDFTYGDTDFEIKITNNPPSMGVGRSVRLRADITSDSSRDEKIRWESRNPEVASVDDSGKVTALHSGEAIIAAMYKSKTATCTIKVNMKGVITIIDDDGRKEFMEKLLPIIKEKNVSIATAIVPNWIGKKPVDMTWDEVAQCADEGAEVLCHTLKHHNAANTEAMDEKELKKEFIKAKRIMYKHGYPGDILVYSHSSGDVRKAREAASEVFKCAIHNMGYSINTKETDRFYLKRFVVEKYLENNLKRVKREINKVRKEGGWMIWELHCGTEQVTDKTLNNLRKAIDYAKKRGVEIVTAQEGYERLINE